jgi:hypothetical protein
MIAARFEALVRARADRNSRRSLMHALAASALGGLALPRAGAAAICHGVNHPCRRDHECCSHQCQVRKGEKKGTCRASKDGGRCASNDDCRGSAFFCDQRCLDPDCTRCAVTDQPFGFCKDDAYC